jgi:CRP-like cAMP-binding protein
MASGLVSQLQSVPIFQGLSEDDLDQLLVFAQRMELAPHQKLFSQGDPADAFFVVLSGGVAVHMLGASGSEQHLADLGPGAVLGEISLLIGGQRTASAEATEPTVLLRFPARRFRGMLEGGSLAAYRLVANLARVLATRLSAADAHMAELVGGSQEGTATVAEDDLDRLRKIFFVDWGMTANS